MLRDYNADMFMGSTAISKIPWDGTMNNKLLILIAWLLYFIVLQTGDGVWRFYLGYCCVLVACVFFYNLEHRTRVVKRKKKAR